MCEDGTSHLGYTVEEIVQTVSGELGPDNRVSAWRATDGSGLVEGISKWT